LLEAGDIQKSRKVVSGSFLARRQPSALFENCQIEALLSRRTAESKNRRVEESPSRRTDEAKNCQIEELPKSLRIVEHRRKRGRSGQSKVNLSTQ
jgi:hypothetical protein